MRIAFATAIAVTLLSPARGAAQFVLPNRPVLLTALNVPLNIPLQLPPPAMPSLGRATAALPALSVVPVLAAPLVSVAALPVNMPLQLPNPVLPLPAIKTILPGPASRPTRLVFAGAATSADADRPSALSELKRMTEKASPETDPAADWNAFDGTRPSETFTLPEQELERDLGLR